MGKKADLAALDLQGVLPAPQAAGSDFFASALVSSGQPAQVRATWVDGRHLFDGRKVRTIDPVQLEKDCDSAKKRGFGPHLKKARDSS